MLTDVGCLLKSVVGVSSEQLWKKMKDCGWWLLNVDTAEEEESEKKNDKCAKNISEPSGVTNI